MVNQPSNINATALNMAAELLPMQRAQISNRVLRL